MVLFAARMGLVTLIFAHRGASSVETENTVRAYRRAVEMGADGVELDVRRTADDVLVTHHDARLADGRVIRDTAASALPLEVPRLGAALDACAGSFVNIEIKNDPNEPDFDPHDRVTELVAVELTERGSPERWLVSSFRYETIGRCRSLLPAVRTAWLVHRIGSFEIRRAVRGGHAAIHPSVVTLDQARLDDAHAAGLVVNTWTCNDTDRLRELIGWGVDGICTDVPDVAVRVRRERRVGSVG